jgi:hypothetical protein
LLELVALLLGIGDNPPPNASPEVERLLGRLILQYGEFHFSKQNFGMKPMVTMSAEIDLRKLLVR